MNGTQIFSSDTMAGAWRLFRFDATAAARPGAANSLALEVFPPQPTDLAITLVDWAPMPPDKEMGILARRPHHGDRPGGAAFSGRIHEAQSARRRQADLTVRVELQNSADHTVQGTLKGKIESIEFVHTVRLGPGEMQVVRLTPEKLPQLKLENPRLCGRLRLGRRTFILSICALRSTEKFPTPLTSSSAYER